MSSRDSAPRLFVYGTLKSNFDNRWAKLLRNSGHFLGPAAIRGRLYRVAHYPGLKRLGAGNSWVLGELFQLRNPQKILEALDQYEGDRFTRVKAMAYLDGVGASSCWAYEYQPPIVSSRRIPEGWF